VYIYIYFFISSIPLPKRSQERFDLENKMISAKISIEIRGDYPAKGSKKYQPKVNLDSFAWQKPTEGRMK